MNVYVRKKSKLTTGTAVVTHSDKSQDYHQSQQVTDFNAKLFHLTSLMKETEPPSCSSSHNSNSSNLHSGSPKVAIPTDRAVCARRGYILKRSLGEGNYSKVKEAEDVRNIAGRQCVAIKIIDCHSAPQDFLLKFLPREINIWPKIMHANIIRMHEVIKTNHKVYMVLEYAGNGDLLTYIQEWGGQPESICKHWIYQLADAVRYLHELNITHRDLKLENILLDAANNCKICDFGFVKVQSSKSELSQTFCGSKAYACPEILSCQMYAPKKADIWALGVIAYIVVTGKMPFNENQRHVGQIIQQQRAQRFGWCKRRHVGVECKQMILSMLNFRPDDRISVHDVLLSQWLKDRPLTVNQRDFPHNSQKSETKRV